MIKTAVYEQKPKLALMLRKFFDSVELRSGEPMIDLVVCNECAPRNTAVKTRCLITTGPVANVGAGQIINCGMEEFNSVIYTSIEDGSAQLCVNRVFETAYHRFVLPREVHVPYFSDLTLDENLLFHCCAIYLEEIQKLTIINRKKRDILCTEPERTLQSINNAISWLD